MGGREEENANHPKPQKPKKQSNFPLRERTSLNAQPTPKQTHKNQQGPKSCHQAATQRVRPQIEGAHTPQPPFPWMSWESHCN